MKNAGSMFMKRLFSTSLLVLAVLGTPGISAKDAPLQVITWPEQGAPIVRFTFTKFKELGTLGRERSYVTDTTAENIWNKPIDGSFILYLYDKNKVRIGEATLTLSNVHPCETVKFQTTIAASGPPVSLSIALPARKQVSLTINTVPQGAVARLDGVEIGTTPKIAQVAVGKHELEFTRDGFNPGKFPFEIGADDASGGSVSFELGTSAHDTVELRDGSVLSGDLVSVSGMEVVVKVGGTDQHLDRNQIKRILFVQRQPSAPAGQ